LPYTYIGTSTSAIVIAITIAAAAAVMVVGVMSCSADARPNSLTNSLLPKCNDNYKTTTIIVIEVDECNLDKAD